MKAYISESELWPCYGVSFTKDAGDDIVDVPEELIIKWQRISDLFFKAQNQIERAIQSYNRKQERIKWLQERFNKANPSRRDKEYILQRFGWEQIDTSLWQKDGRQVRLHEAYNECKRQFEESLNEHES